jgi:hypothetical protein
MKALKGIPCLGGIPTKPDVDILLGAFAVPEEDQLITYEQIGAVIGIEYNGPKMARYRTVVDAWRKHLAREHRLFSDPEIGVGIRFSTPSQRVDSGTKKIASAVKAVSKTISGVLDIPVERKGELTPEQRNRCDKLTANCAVMITAYKTASRKQLEAPKLGKN